LVRPAAGIWGRANDRDDQGPAGVVYGRDRMAPEATVDCGPL